MTAVEKIAARSARQAIRLGELAEWLKVDMARLFGSDYEAAFWRAAEQVGTAVLASREAAK